jgi:cell division septation protein DedD
MSPNDDFLARFKLFCSTYKVCLPLQDPFARPIASSTEHTDAQMAKPCDASVDQSAGPIQEPDQLKAQNLVSSQVKASIADSPTSVADSNAVPTTGQAAEAMATPGPKAKVPVKSASTKVAIDFVVVKADLAQGLTRMDAWKAYQARHPAEKTYGKSSFYTQCDLHFSD